MQNKSGTYFLSRKVELTGSAGCNYQPVQFLDFALRYCDQVDTYSSA